MKDSVDFVIVGSGVSGGRVAWELTRAGARCVLLEAGREYSAPTFPDNELDYSSQLFWGGGPEVSADGHLGFLRAKCVGGTSIVNQALLDRFDELAWDQWRDRSGVGFFNATEMEHHYDASAERLSINQIPPERYNRNARIFTQAFGHRNLGWKPLDRAQGDCALEQGSDCIVCLGGCPRDSKQSSLITTIRWAREKGLRVESECEAERLEVRADGARVLAVQRGQAVEFAARKVVLAAGALGNTALLLRSGFGSKLPALGTSFTCHPQYMTYAFFDDPVDAHKGAFQSVKSHDPALRKLGLKLENVYAPPIGTAMLLPGYGREHHARMRKYRHYASMEVAIQDDAAGRIRLAKGGKLVIEKSFTDRDRERVRKGLAIVRELFDSVHAREVTACMQGFGLHLMGGCPIGTDSGRSVVSPEFRVHGLPNVFAADSSVFPAAPGINPSFTVMALAHRASQEMLK